MASTIKQRVNKHRQTLRQAGLRPIQLWIPDTRRPDFAAECRRQSLLLANSQTESADQAWVESAADVTDWQ